MVGFEDSHGSFGAAVGFSQSFDLVIENVGQAFDEDEWKDVIFKFGGIFLATNIASTIPEHLLHGFGAKDGATAGTTFAAARLFRTGEISRVSGDPRFLPHLLKKLIQCS